MAKKKAAAKKRSIGTGNDSMTAALIDTVHAELIDVESRIQQSKGAGPVKTIEEYRQLEGRSAALKWVLNEAGIAL